MSHHTVSLAVYTAHTLADYLFGLTRLARPIPFLLRTRLGIHTFGMHYSLDIVILNEKNIVVQTKESLPPNRIFVWNPRFTRILELPEGLCQKYTITPGTHIIFKALTPHSVGEML